MRSGTLLMLLIFTVFPAVAQSWPEIISEKSKEMKILQLENSNCNVIRFWTSWYVVEFTENRVSNILLYSKKFKKKKGQYVYKGIASQKMDSIFAPNNLLLNDINIINWNELKNRDNLDYQQINTDSPTYIIEYSNENKYICVDYDFSADFGKDTEYAESLYSIFNKIEEIYSLKERYLLFKSKIKCGRWWYDFGTIGYTKIICAPAATL